MLVVLADEVIRRDEADGWCSILMIFYASCNCKICSLFCSSQELDRGYIMVVISLGENNNSP